MRLLRKALALTFNELARHLDPSESGQSNAEPEGSEQKPTSPSAAYPSLHVIYSEIKDRVALQLAQAESLDTKSGLVLASSGLLTAAVASLKTSASTELEKEPNATWCIFSHQLEIMTIVNWISASGIVCFLAIVIVSYKAYGLTSFLVTPSPDERESNFLRDFSSKTEAETMMTLVADRVTKDLIENERLIESKRMRTRWALRGLLAQATLMAIMAGLQLLI